MPSSTYDTLNKGWKSTCKVLFGAELGELKDYEEWLLEYLPKVARRKSHVSGKEVVLAMDDYCKGAKFVSLGQEGQKAIEPLTINEVKDIDSIAAAVSEKWEYTGNKVLGNSKFVESSDDIINSHFVSDSVGVSDSAYVYASSIITANSKYIFGAIRSDIAEFVIRGMRCSNVKRCFESRFILDCSDLYFCATCIGSHDLMFSFNQRNKKYRIGNLQLPKDKYQSLKTKLLEQVKGELVKERSFPSIFQLVPNEKTKNAGDIPISVKKTTADLKPLEKGFQSTFNILFKRAPTGSIVDYGDWLSRHNGKLREIKSPFGNMAYTLPCELYPIYSLVPEKRVVTWEEANQLGDLCLNEAELASVASIRKALPKIGYFTDEILEGKCHNNPKTLTAIDSSNTYDVCVYKCEHVAFNMYCVFSKYVYGGRSTADCHFCMNCYNSSNLHRCFEVDSSSKCSDTYFSHNCEGLSDAMFCFNAKSKKHVIGNLQLQPDKYRKLKDLLLGQMADEIEKNKGLKRDIFNIGCGRS